MANQDVTVKRFIEYLKTLSPNALIVMSRDSEGNGFKKLTDFGVGGVQPVTIDKRGVFEDVEVHSEDDAPKGAVQALVIYPD